VQAAGREVYEECGVKLPQDDIKFLTCMNVRNPDKDYHTVSIWMFCEVEKTDYRFVNLEPEKHKDWYWHKWNDFCQMENLFFPFKEFFK
jgi:ADP-ribose pyrophosphatase YjhB (NUDIX family)